MILKVAYNNDCQQLVDNLTKVLSEYSSVQLQTFNEDLFKERKKAFKLKGGFSAREVPFAALIDDNKVPVVAFYNEANTCTIENILNTLNKFVVYNKDSE